MDQVDKIIFHHFSILGWECEEDVKSLNDLDISEVAELLIKCLYAIKSDCELPLTFPHNMSQRFRIAGKIADEIKALGYVGDLGYQSFLYPNAIDLRQIFIFLIEKLPKDSPITTKDPADFGKRYSIYKEAKRKIKESSSRPWFPPHCHSLLRSFQLSTRDPSIFFNSSHLYIPNRQLSRRINEANSLLLSNLQKGLECSNSFSYEISSLLPTSLSLHSENLGHNLSDFNASDDESVESCKYVERFKGMKCSELPDWKFTGSTILPSEEIEVYIPKREIIESRDHSDQQPHQVPTDVEVRLSDVTERLAVLRSELSEIDVEKEEKLRIFVSLNHALEERNSHYENELKKMTALQKTSALVSDPQSATMKLEAALVSYKDKETKFQNQWKDHKASLSKELNEVQDELNKKMSKKNEVLKDIHLAKTTIKRLQEEVKKKESLLIQLEEEKNQMPRGTSRSEYTKQILDICDKVQKQKKETQKIISETRIVQKDINTLTGKLQRTFTLAEDSSFKFASQNDSARPIYRFVVSIHEENGKIIDFVRECGSIQREIADIKLQLNSEKSKNTVKNLKKLQDDLTKLKRENVILKEKITS